MKWPCLSGTIKINRGWLIKRQFKICTWHSVKATVLCNSTDTINVVSLPWAVPGPGLLLPCPHIPMAGTGWAPLLQLSTCCCIPESQQNPHRTSPFRTRQGYFFFLFIVSALLFPFDLHYPKPHSNCVKSENTMLNSWARSAARCSLLLHQSWFLALHTQTFPRCEFLQYVT